MIPLVTFFFLGKIQIIYSFSNSFARTGWLVRSVRGGGGGRWILHFTKIVSVLTDGDNYILKVVLSIFNTIAPSMKPKSGLFFLHADDPE